MALDENFFADSPLVALLVDPDPSELDLIPDVPPFLRQRAATHNPPAPLRATSRSALGLVKARLIWFKSDALFCPQSTKR